LPDTKVFSSGNDFLHHVRASGETSIVHGYFINSYCFLTSKITTAFWKLQLAIITQLRLIRSLSLIVAIVIPDQKRAKRENIPSQINNYSLEGFIAGHLLPQDWQLHCGLMQSNHCRSLVFSIGC
jgi:hypothetical protein